MKTSVVLAVSIVLVSIFFCHMVMAVPTLPADLQIVQPDPSLPKELSAFFGKWEWISNPAEFFIIVEKIEKEKANLYVWRSGSWPQGTPMGWERIEAKVIKDRRKYKLSYLAPYGDAEYTLMGEDLIGYSGSDGWQLRRVPSEIVMEEFMVPAADPGINLYVRNKHPEGMNTFAAEKTLLFVHGSTYPSEAGFDMKLNGLSWMDYIARHGYDVYMVDLRGYGKSTRPSEMDKPAADNEPIVRTETAVKDVGAAVDFILKRRGVSKINLLGWSWGTVIMGWYTSQNNDKVNRLVLYAPKWIRKTASLMDSGSKLGAYRVVSRHAAKARWLTGVPENKKADLIPPGWFEAWADAAFATDPAGSKQTPPLLRAPNGTVQDDREFWGAGKAQYDPAEIRVPTFLAHAEWDADLPSYMLYAYFAKLTNVPYKRYVEIGEGTHTIMMEKNRMQLFQAVQQFLDERLKPNE